MTPNVFIHGSDYDDNISVAAGNGAGGNNIIDGGGGSNFITLGIGSDTVYVDGRNPDHNLWSTIANFHQGDQVTVWGVTPQISP